MKSTLAITAILITLLSSPASAGPVDQHGRTPADAYHGDTMGGLKLCELNYELAVSNQALGKETAPEDDPIACINKLQEKGLKSLDRAMKFAKRPAARESLKAFHAAWVSTVRSIRPVDSETKASYARRRAAAWSRLDELWTKFELEDR